MVVSGAVAAAVAAAEVAVGAAAAAPATAVGRSSTRVSPETRFLFRHALIFSPSAGTPRPTVLFPVKEPGRSFHLHATSRHANEWEYVTPQHYADPFREIEWMGLCARLSWPDDFQPLAADRMAKGCSVVQIVAGLYTPTCPR